MKRFVLPLLIAFAAPSFAADAPHSSPPAPVEAAEEGDAPMVMLDVKSDQILLDGEPIAQPQLEQVLKQAGPDVKVVLRVDRELSHKRVVEMFDHLKVLGVGKVYLCTVGDPQ
ncbi:ExbD/TolR family protein [Sulfuriroseicoccus oceanibius]|uniref:Biopolymer transporter ExbD n=1 Tax=Sulfuriroseicoccus oceanibius TaxID=2707525 RepID=A0A6B3L2K2_9BACT|nr:biopolymer transporter ExbD [Sulfuriroseicoccus oceanibius]QQL43966.1 biopolymer transporter ExbD [Sulfuriroseicoccus oceanibius]